MKAKPTIPLTGCPAILAFLLLCFNLSTTAQTISADRIEIFVEPIGISHYDPAVDDTRSNMAQDTVRLRLAITLPPGVFANSVSAGQRPVSFLIKAGTTSGVDDLANQVISLDSRNTLPAAMSFERDGRILYVTLGEFTGITQVYGSVEMKNVNGNRSAVITTSF